MDTVPVVGRVLGGMCMNDSVADPTTHALLDLNGDFKKAGYRTTRQGTRPLFSGAGYAFDFRGVYTYQAFSGELRAIAVAEVALTIAVPILGNSITFNKGELVFLVFNVDNPVAEPIAYSKFGLYVDSGGVAQTDVYTSDSHPWTAVFYQQRNILYIAGHRMSLLTIDFDALRSASIETNYPSTPVAPRAGFFSVLTALFRNTTDQSGQYIDGVYAPTRMSRVDNQAFYTFSVPTWATTDETFDLYQSIIPNWRMNQHHTDKYLLDENIFFYSIEEEPTVVYALHNAVAANGRRIVDVRQAGTRWALITDSTVTFRPSLAYYLPENPDPAYMGAEVSKGTSAAGSIVELDSTLVFVNHQGIVRASPEGAVTVSSPFLDALFTGDMRSSLPIELSDMGRRCGVPYQIDHTRLEHAQATLLETEDTYVVAVTTVGSSVLNDLLILWDYGENRFTLHHQVVLDEDLKDYRTSVNPDPPPATLYHRNLPSVSWVGVDTGVRSDGSSVTVCCNNIGIFHMWDGDVDYVHPLGFGSQLIATFIPSMRVSATFTKDDFSTKAVQNLDVILRANVFESSGIAALYVDGEGSSTETDTTDSLTSERPFRMTMKYALSEEPEAFGKFYWGKDGELWRSTDPATLVVDEGTKRVWARPDYHTTRTRAPLPNMQWWRVTFYDTIGELPEQAREMEVMSFGFRVGHAKD